ncbi:MAG: alpha/beta fold hydrolase [Hydrocarboniphaga sp.]|nr:alpha/beta fold hydrolase [Hydrocarboniphaga sp.]
MLDCGDGIRLTGLHTPRAGALGLVVLIHGWEGSHESSYQYSMACALHRDGYSVFRLNLRDHAGTHDLNEEMFHSARMAEVFGAIRAVQVLDAAPALFVVGFSLGGNFALRVGMQGPAAGVYPKLSIGISPAIHPRHTLEAIDSGPRIFHGYFLDKWRLTMDLKSEAWPGRFDFTRHRGSKNFIEITKFFVEDYSEYETLEDYFERYTLTPQMLMDSAAPLAVITARDDSVIPIVDFDGLYVRGSVLAYDLTAHGGHCGFIEDWALNAWTESRVLQLLRQAA